MFIHRYKLKLALDKLESRHNSHWQIGLSYTELIWQGEQTSWTIQTSSTDLLTKTECHGCEDQGGAEEDKATILLVSLPLLNEHRTLIYRNDTVMFDVVAAMLISHESIWKTESEKTLDDGVIVVIPMLVIV